MPAVFMGHGSPMLALEESGRTRALAQLGKDIMDQFGTPKGLLMVSAHWYTHGWWVQTQEMPRQVYDMYGFPQALYDLRYPAKGCPDLGRRVLDLAAPGFEVREDAKGSWGIDHGAWTTLVHVFPQADVPVAQLSVNGDATPRQAYEAGRRLAALRDEGYLVMASGNVVHSLQAANWEMEGRGYPWADAFDATVRRLVEARDDETLVGFESLKDADKAAPTPDHFLPLLYVLGASEGERPRVFNDACDLGSISMTSYAFGME